MLVQAYYGVVFWRNLRMAYCSVSCWHSVEAMHEGNGGRMLMLLPVVCILFRV